MSSSIIVIYSSVTRSFRRGAIVIPEFDVNKGPSILDTILEWTSFQTTIAGIDCSTSEPCYEEEINVEEMRS